MGPGAGRPLGGGGPGGMGGGGAKLCLSVQIGDHRWETLYFSPGDNVQQKGSEFLQSKGLKAAFLSGLSTRMQQMVATGQAQMTVDIVDLI